MEELASKIAEMLDISVQGAIDIYPVIRNQYIWYEILNGVGGWIMLLGIMLLIVIGITFAIRDDTRKFDWRTEEITEEWANIDKIFKIELSVFVLLVVIDIATSITLPFLAPDIMLIKDFLG